MGDHPCKLGSSNERQMPMFMHLSITKIIKGKISFLMFIALLNFWSAAAVGLEGAEIDQSFNRLKTTDKKERESAFKEITNPRTQVINQIIDALNASPNSADIEYKGYLHLVIEAAGVYRTEEALVPLLSKIKIRLNRASIPVGIQLDDTEFYPAVNALIAIGGNDLKPRLLDCIRNSPDEETSILCGWVLQEHLGEKLALDVLKQELNKTRAENPKSKLQTLISKIELQGNLTPPRYY
jgi:hypothetical protein